MRGDLTPLLRLYRILTRLAGGIFYRKVARKLRAQDVPENRIAERLGQATAARPAGPLVWFHAASVGESLSVLTLITRLGQRHPQLNTLITSGTATSAQLIARRMPPRTLHQYAPIDSQNAVEAFYDHWQPNAGIFVESEIWPNLLLEGHRRKIPLALLNARLSQKSARDWQKWPATAKAVMGVFAILIAQNTRSAEILATMGAPRDRIRRGTNLKAMSAPLPVDDAALQDLQTALKERPRWVASSTHPGEEEIVLAAHTSLLAQTPNLCLILIPRHPDRGDAIADLIAQTGLTCARRSLGQLPQSGEQVYLADTLGETGTFYAATPMVFMAGSLKPIGGHNPFEPAQAGTAILTGPHRASFEETYTALLTAKAAKETATAQDIAQAVGGWLQNPTALQQARAAARDFVAGQDKALDHVIETLEAALGLAAPQLSETDPSDA